jgi:hypothetical protein
MNSLVDAAESCFTFLDRSRQDIFVIKKQKIKQDDHQVFPWMSWRVILGSKEWASTGDMLADLVEPKNAVLGIGEDNHFCNKDTCTLESAFVCTDA